MAQAGGSAAGHPAPTLCCRRVCRTNPSPHTDLTGQLMDDFDRSERRTLYGANELVIPVSSVAALMGAEMIHPFFIFQYASVTIW